MEERLQKYIAASGVTSRRKAEQLITDGKVEVNGKVVTLLGTKVGPNDEIRVEGKLINKKDNQVYYLLNKPEGYISSTADEVGRKTIMDLMTPIKERIYPIGRLDYDTSGLILLTNDGDFSNMMLKPENEIEKEYHVKISGLLRKEESKQIEKGMNLDDYTAKPCKIYNVKYDDKKENTYLDIVITEGKNREIRRLFENIGHSVIDLKRTRFGNITLDVRKGTYRMVRPYEVKCLKLLAQNGKRKI